MERKVSDALVGMVQPDVSGPPEVSAVSTELVAEEAAEAAPEAAPVKYDHTDAQPGRRAMLVVSEIAEVSPTLFNRLQLIRDREATRLRIAEWKEANARFDARAAAELMELSKHNPLDDSLPPKEISDY